MYVTNLLNTKLGLSGTVVLRAREVNRYIDDENKALVEAALRAKAANLVSVVREQGLVKTVTTNAVKTLTVDVGGIGTAPRTSTEKVEALLKRNEAKAEKVVVEKKEEVKQEVVAEVKEPEAAVEEVKVNADVNFNSDKVEEKAEEVEEEKSFSKKNKKK